MSDSLKNRRLSDCAFIFAETYAVFCFDSALFYVLVGGQGQVDVLHRPPAAEKSML